MPESPLWMADRWPTVLLIGIGVAVLLLALAWARPPYDWDGLYYHVPAIHEWVRFGVGSHTCAVIPSPLTQQSRKP